MSLVVLLGLGVDLVYDNFFEDFGVSVGVTFDDPDDVGVLVKRPVAAHAELFFRAIPPRAAAPAVLSWNMVLPRVESRPPASWLAGRRGERLFGRARARLSPEHTASQPAADPAARS